MLAAAPANAAWDCADRTITVRPPVEAVDRLVITLRKPAATAIKELELVATSTSDVPTRVAVYEHLGALYFQQKRFDDARRVYRAGFDLEDARTKVRENFRAALAKALSQLIRDDEIIALFERSDRPACSDANPEGQLALAYAYAEKSRFAEAQAIVDAQLPRQIDDLAGDDVSPWEKLNMTLACRTHQAESCARAWDRLLRWPFRDDSLTSQLTVEWPRLRAWPEGEATLERARRDRMVENDRVVAHAFARVHPKPRKRVSPRYPAVAARAQIEGSVLLELLIAEDGHVTAVRVVKATPARIFDEAAVSAVRRWTFEPATIDGKPVASTGLQQIHFSMQKG